MPSQRQRFSRSSPPEIVVDIDDVAPETKLSELTVEQYVQLLTQVIGQVDPRSAKQRRVEVIAEFIAVLKSDSEPVNAIKKSFAEIGKTLPQVLLEVARRIRDAQVREAKSQGAHERSPGQAERNETREQPQGRRARSAGQAEPDGTHAQTQRRRGRSRGAG